MEMQIVMVVADAVMMATIKDSNFERYVCDSGDDQDAVCIWNTPFLQTYSVRDDDEHSSSW